MHYNDDSIYIDKYLEDRLNPLEKDLFEKELETNKNLKTNFNAMKDLFDALNNHANCMPPCSISLEAIMNSPKVVQTNNFSMKLFGQSLIAAGIFVALFSNNFFVMILNWLNSLSNLHLFN